MEFVIRDDDLSYYTDVQKLRELYDPIFERGFKVSFAAIPYERKVENKDDRSKYKKIDEWKWLGENKELVEYIQPKVRQGLVEIMLHGFDHDYEITRGGAFIGECIHKSEEGLFQDLKRGKEYLESLFGPIISFVPPSNQIDGKTTRVLERIGIRNLSGTILPTFNRELSVQNFINWGKYCAYRIVTGHRWTHPLWNGYTWELTYCTLTDNFLGMKRCLDFSYKKKAPFVLALHYWDVLSGQKKMDVFENILEYAIHRNERFHPSLLKEAFK